LAADDHLVGPLADITIIDCTMALAGPFGAALLADLGANVIKVEPPSGDGSRSLPPLMPDYANPGTEPPAGVDYGGYFASINRNKRSIVLDLKAAGDREVLLRLCDQADALIENMRVGVMDRLGVGYEVIRRRNPALVYGAIRGYGDPRTGESPYADWPAYDIVAQSMGGHVHITGPENGGGYPGGVSVGDIYPGTLLALGVVSAVHHARRTGEGQFLDVGMYDAMLAYNETVIANYGVAGIELGPRGRHHPNLMPFGIYPAKDGSVAIAAPGPGHWAELCRAMERDDLIDDPRSRNVHLRRRNQDVIEPVISAWTGARTKKEIMASLGGRVPCGPVNTAKEIFEDPHVAAREMITRFKPPGDNPEVAIVGSPIKFTATPTGLRHGPPRLGEHTDEVLREFGIERTGPERTGRE
jgi:crotonobetainyl-CoA:carnitine CoA-transferase CaiB-like acyl-CoA transferase